MPAPKREAMETAQAFMARVAKIETMLCPCCKAQLLKVVATVAGCRQLPAVVGMTTGQPRGPP